MNAHMVDEIARAVLYEGYLLYPYRASALKNRHRFSFGVVVPRGVHEAAGDERSCIQTECLLRAKTDAAVDVRARFLHLFESGQRSAATAGWQEAAEREVALDVALCGAPSVTVRRLFKCGPDSPGQQPVRGEVTAKAERLTSDLVKLRLVISNVTDVPAMGEHDRAAYLKSSLVSAHAILHATNGGEFLSLMDPPGDVQEAATACKNVGLWPVMVGEANDRDAMLASPIILYDYPQIAPESAGDFFDGTEIDEMLALRVMTMTDEEKAQARQTDPRARDLVDRTERLSQDHLLKLHGVLRGLRPAGEPTR